MFMPYNPHVRKVLLFGYFGEDNYGDDLLLWSAALGLAKHIETGKAELSVLSTKPYPKFPVPATFIPRLKLSEVNKAVRQSDIVCAPGGGLLQDSTSLKSLLYYLNIVRLAQLLGKPVLLLAQGIGPIKSQIGRLACSRILRRAYRISVRDEASKELLASLLGPKAKIEVTADFAFSLGSALRPDERGQIARGAKQEPVILVCPRETGNPEIQLTQLSTALIYAGNLFETGKPIYRFFAMHKGRDSELCRKLISRVGGEMITAETDNPLSAFAAFDGAAAVLSFRLHGCVVSALRAKPFVAISYDPKVESFANSFNKQCFQSDGFDPKAVGRAIADSANSISTEYGGSALENAITASKSDTRALVEMLD